MPSYLRQSPQRPSLIELLAPSLMIGIGLRAKIDHSTLSSDRPREPRLHASNHDTPDPIASPETPRRLSGGSGAGLYRRAVGYTFPRAARPAGKTT